MPEGPDGQQPHPEDAVRATAGWYDDPHLPGRFRYWDGSAWTEHVAAGSQPLPPAHAAPQSTGAPPLQGRVPKPSRGLIVAAVAFLVLAFVMPALSAGALVIGILLIPRGRVGVGATMIVLSVVCAVAGLLFIRAFLVVPYRLPSDSMAPTIHAGEHVFVNRIGLRFSDPKVGDIVAFHPPKGAEDNRCGVAAKAPDEPCPLPTRERSDVTFIKRIVAGPGDRIAISDGHVLLNGRRQSERFVKLCTGEECNFPRAIRVPQGYYFMMGDNRGASPDSRFWGPVPKRWIIGEWFATY